MAGTARTAATIALLRLCSHSEGAARGRIAIARSRSANGATLQSGRTSASARAPAADASTVVSTAGTVEARRAEGQREIRERAPRRGPSKGVRLLVAAQDPARNAHVLHAFA